jgi:ferric-dicitrate binding protein FerR (iron transport regulator)
MDHREHRIYLRAAAWVQEIHRAPFHNDPKRQAKLRVWLDQSNTHRDAFQHALRVWAQLKHIDRTNRLVTSSLDARLALKRRTQTDSHARRWGAAAVVVLSVLVMPILAGRLTASATLFETDVGESRSIAIGDGTTINLNSGTRIAVELHGRYREVHLMKGEAFFSVAPGDGRSLQVFAPFAIAAADGAQFDVSRNMVDMAIVTVKGVAAIVANDPYTLSDTVFGDSGRLSKAALVVRPSAAVRIGWGGQGVQIRRETVSATQLERLLTWRHVPLSFGNERSEDSEAVTETFNRLNAEKMVIADSVTATQSVSGQALATVPIIYSAIALERELTLLIVDSEHGSPRLYGNGSHGSAAPTSGPSP